MYKEADSKETPPFLKWAGGKRWLIESHPELFPANYDHYFEPFLGSASVFFHLQPTRSTLSDSNSWLINTYKSIKSSHRKITSRLKWHHQFNSNYHYYKIRSIPFKPGAKAAADFIYLNRACWNGLYRVNQKGEFNVPIGTRRPIYRNDNFLGISQLLENSELKCQDFVSIKSQIKKGDFCFLDPPYTVKHNNNGFLRYNEKIFSWEDQLKLKELIVHIEKIGAKALMLNANHISIRDLYKNTGISNIVSRNSQLASDPKKRGRTTEFALKVGY